MSAASRLVDGLDNERVRSLAIEAVRFVPDVVLMLRGVLSDPRVPGQAKAEAGAALAYLVSPINGFASAIPLIGAADDVAVLSFAIRRLLVGAGEPVLREHWRGNPRGLDLLLSLTTALAGPKGVLRRAALLGAALSAVRGKRGTGRGSRVIDGEVIARRPG